MKTTTRIARALHSLPALALSLAALSLVQPAANAATITNTYTLSGTIPVGVDGLLPWIVKGTLPTGSILRAVSVNATLDSQAGDSWASDICAYFDPTPTAPGTEAILQVGGYDVMGTVAHKVDWASGQDGTVGAKVIDKKFAGTDFADTIDLNDCQLSVGNDYDPSSWSGTITVEYYEPQPATIVTFGLPGNMVFVEGHTIVLNVPCGTVVTNLAPVYTLSSGTCVPASGSVNNFTTPRQYTVSDLSITNVYTVSVNVSKYTVSSNTFDLGPQDSGTTIAIGVDGLLPWIVKGALPTGSMLRAVSVNARLDAQAGDSWASDVCAYFDPTPTAPGTEAILQVGGYGAIGTVVQQLGWGNGQDGTVGATVIDRKTTPANFPNNIDLNACQLSVGNDYDPSTWSGTLTVEYYVPQPAIIVTFGLPGHMFLVESASIVLSVPYGTDVTTLAPIYTLSSGTCVPASGSANNFSTPQQYTVTEGAITNVYTVTVVEAAIFQRLNVNIDTAVRTDLVGPAGGSGATWNQQLGMAGLTASGLLDDNGGVTTIGFTLGTDSIGSWGTPSLTLLTGGAFQWDVPTPADLVINGLSVGTKYDLYLASFHPNEQGNRSLFSTTNTTTTVGTQIADSGGPNGNDATWVEGVNYVLFSDVEPNVDGTITVTMVGDYINNEKRAYLSGFQLVNASIDPTATPFVDITNDNFTVATDSATIGGTNNDGVFGFMELTSTAGSVITFSTSIAARASWTATVGNLVAGATNFVTITGTNGVGYPANDTVRIYRTPNTFIDIINVALGPRTTYSMAGVGSANYAQSAVPGTAAPFTYTGTTWNQPTNRTAMTGLLTSDGGTTVVGFLLSNWKAGVDDQGGAGILNLLGGGIHSDGPECSGGGNPDPGTIPTLTITGLVAASIYDLVIISGGDYTNENDFNIGGTINFSNPTNPVLVGGTTRHCASNPRKADEWVEGSNYVTFMDLAATNGMITVRDRATAGAFSMNGFQLKEIVPEPAAVLLGVAGVVTLLRRRRPA